MGTLERLKLALVGVSSNKFRSFLTLLGIIIGVGAVILMVSLGSGTQKVVSGQFSTLFTRQIFVFPNWDIPYQQRGKLTFDDEKLLEEATVGVEDVVPFCRDYLRIKYDGKEIDSSVAGVLENVLELTSLKLDYGRSITQDDIKNHERIAVVGENILNQLSNVQQISSLLGEGISIDGNKLIIVGILGQSASTIGLSNDVVLIPQTTYQDLWRRNVDQIDYFIISYDDSSTEKDIISQIYYFLDSKYGLVNEKSRFNTEGVQGQVDVMQKIVQVLTYVLGGIASISLLVGGIGVMNIMLVTVKERTREIGVRMAIGANSGDIQNQFLLEAIILTVGGGLIGIVTGSGLSALLNMILSKAFQWWQGSMPLWIIALSFGVTVTIGLIFGYYPAYKASKMNPIEALRHE